jgi:hypothetical protein
MADIVTPQHRCNEVVSPQNEHPERHERVLTAAAAPATSNNEMTLPVLRVALADTDRAKGRKTFRPLGVLGAHRLKASGHPPHEKTMGNRWQPRRGSDGRDNGKARAGAYAADLALWGRTCRC